MGSGTVDRRGRTEDEESAARRAEAMASAARHSRRVQVLKRLLPAIGAAVVVAFIGRSVVAERLLPGFSVSSALVTAEGLTMVEPKLSGRANQRAYEMIGDRAVQSLTDPNRIRIDRVHARLELEGGGLARIEAQRAFYDRGRETLRLEEDVRVETTDGRRVRLNAADIDLGSGRLASDGPVDITLPNGTVRANGAEVSDNGRVLVFKGDVRMVLQPEQRGADEPADPTRAAADPHAARP